MVCRRKKIILPKEAVPKGFKIRAGTPEDTDFVRELSTSVFSQFGDYGTFLPMYLTHPSVFTAIGESHGLPIGFVMLALVVSDRSWNQRAKKTKDKSKTNSKATSKKVKTQKSIKKSKDNNQSSAEQEWLDAEILAIAVRPDHQTRKIGTKLMKHALNSAQGWYRTTGIRSVQLNVAHTNHKAFAFFKKMGFFIIDEEDGSYPRGQRSIRMARLFDDDQYYEHSKRSSE